MANDRNNHRTKSLLFGKLWWDISLLVTAGGSLLSLVYTRERVCLLCLEACLQYLVHLPIWFLTGLKFSRHKQALCKESMDLMFSGLYILFGNAASCSLGIMGSEQSCIDLDLYFATKYTIYRAGEEFIARVGVKDHDFMLLKRLGKKEKEVSNVPFWGYVMPNYILF